MDLLNFFERNFETEEIEESQNEEINSNFESFLESEKRMKSFRVFTAGIHEFMDQMDPSEDEDEDDDEDEERDEERDGERDGDRDEDGENITLNAFDLPQPDQPFEEEEFGEMEDSEPEQNPEKERFESRISPFPASVRDDTRICLKCKLPLSRKSMKRHLKDKHNIDTSNIEDFCDSYTVKPEFEKLELNPKTNQPQVRVKFRGKRESQKKDVFTTNNLWGLKSFRKYIRNISKNGTRRQKRLVESDQIQREKAARKKAADRYGRYAGKNKYECPICRKRKSPINATMMCHNNGDNEVPHVFCNSCIKKWIKVKGGSCPLCTRPGVPIKIYHK